MKMLILYLPLLGAIVPRFSKMNPKRLVLLSEGSRPLGSHSVGRTVHFYSFGYWIRRDPNIRRVATGGHDQEFSTDYRLNLIKCGYQAIHFKRVAKRMYVLKLETICFD